MNTGQATSDTSTRRVESVAERWARRACGTLALGGGATGLVASFAELPGFSSALAFAIGLVFMAVYGAGVWIGLRLIENVPGTWKLLNAYMWLQIPVLQTSTITYFFGSLLGFSWIYAGESRFRSIFAPGSGWQFSLFTPQPAVAVGVNAVAVCVLLTLAVLKSRR